MKYLLNLLINFHISIPFNISTLYTYVSMFNSPTSSSASTNHERTSTITPLKGGEEFVAPSTPLSLNDEAHNASPDLTNEARHATAEDKKVGQKLRK